MYHHLSEQSKFRIVIKIFIVKKKYFNKTRGGNEVIAPAIDTINRILDEQGRTQAWVITRMNLMNPSLNMDRSKFSAITTGSRKMSGDELLAFCQAVEVSPDEFLKPRMPDEAAV